MKKIIAVMLALAIVFGSMANFSLVPWSELVVDSFAAEGDPFKVNCGIEKDKVFLNFKITPDVEYDFYYFFVLYNIEDVELFSAEAAVFDDGEAWSEGDVWEFGAMLVCINPFTEEQDFKKLTFHSLVQTANFKVYYKGFYEDDEDIIVIPPEFEEMDMSAPAEDLLIQAEELFVAADYSKLDEFNVQNPATDYLTFNLNSDGASYTITDCDTAYSGVMSIPGDYDGLPVTAIGVDAFRDCVNLTEIIVPDTIKTIGGSAFRNCKNITNVILPDGLTTISGAMFTGCTSLQSITIPSTIVSVGGYAFSGCTALKYVYYHSGTEEDWNKITFGGSNTALTDAYIHFNSKRHTFDYEWTVDVEPGCVQPGEKSFHCSYCDYKRSVTAIEPIGHSFGETEIVKAPDCVNDGQFGKTCSTCGEVEIVDGSDYVLPDYTLIDSSEYPESDHDYSNNMYKTYTFSYDGAEYLKIKFSNSTYTEQGYDYIYLYDANGELLGTYDGNELAGKVFEIEGDSFSLELTTDGSVGCYGFSFDEISYRRNVSVEALGHSYGEWEIKTPPTCTENGKKQKECLTCGDVVEENVEPIGHSYGEWTVETDYTCTEDGVMVQLCENCGDAIRKSGDDAYSCLLIDNSLYPTYKYTYNSWRDLTKYEYSYKYTGSKTAKRLVITLSDDTIVDTNTRITIYDGSGNIVFTSRGVRGDLYAFANRSFTVEGDSFRIARYRNGDSWYNQFGFKSIVAHVDLLAAHRFGDYEIVIEPTFLEDGLERSTCSGCGLTKDRVVSALYKSQLTFKLNSARTGYIIVDCNGASGDITLPSEHNGLPVTGIGYEAFRNCSSITSIEIPESITSIGFAAFADCISLNSLELPESITNIDSRALWYSLVIDLTINNDYCMQQLELDYYSSYDMNYYNYCPLTNLTLGKNVSYFNARAFYDLKGGTSYSLFNGVTVHPENECFYSEDGVLYNKDTTEILFCSDEKTEIIIPNTVKIIGEYAFCGCNKLTSVQIPVSVREIENYAFVRCSELVSLVIPGNVRNIGKQVFGDCVKLSEITLSEGVKSLGSGVFYNCQSLENIVLPSTITSLNYSNGSSGEGTFYACHAKTITVNNDYCAYVINCDDFLVVDEYNEGTPTFEKMILGPNVNAVKDIYNNNYYFDRAINAKNVEVDPQNDNFCVVDGVLMTKDKKEIVYFPWGVETDEYIIPDYVTSIGEYAFSEVLRKKGLKSLDIHSNVDKIMANAFYRGYNYKKINNLYLHDVAAWCEIEFDSANSNAMHVADKVYFDGEIKTELVIPGSVKKINNYAFAGYKGVENITIENGVEAIGRGAFLGNYDLQKITLPESLNSFSYESFEGCYATTVVVNNAYTFSNFSSLWFEYPYELVVEIGANVDEINCENSYIYDVTVNNDNDNFCMVDGVLFNKDKTKLVYYPLNCSNEYEIPNTVTTIGAYAFKAKNRNSGFSLLKIPDSLKKIEFGAFDMSGYVNQSYTLRIEDVVDWCSVEFEDYSSNPIPTFENIYFNNRKLTRLVIPGELNKLNSYAFCGCKDIETIIIEEGIKSIGKSVFRGCHNIEKIILPESITHIENGAFFNSTIKEITVNNNYTVNNIYSYYPYNATIVIGANIDGIDASCFKAGEILVDEDNNTYAEIDGVLFSKDKTKLIYYPVYAGNGNDYQTPSTTKIIGSYAFSHKISSGYFNTLKISKTVVKIEENAFEVKYNGSYGNWIDNLYLPTVSDWCKITFVNEKSNPISISNNVLFNNYAVENVVVPSKTEKISKYAFYNADFITSLVVENGVQSIGEYAFRNCDNLESVDIAGSVKIIDRGAFMSCVNLGSIKLRPGVEKLGHYSFYEAPLGVDQIALREITIPVTTTYISRYAFSYLETIIGAEGSYAQEYAENLVYDFVPCVHEIENTMCKHCGTNYSLEGLLVPVNSETRIDEANCVIYTTLQSPDSVDDLIVCEDGTEAAVTTKNNTLPLGTGTKITVFKNNKAVAVYTLVICGDLNGDGVCDVLDVSQTALLANEFHEETAAEAYAANGNDCGEVNILSYQNVVNMALS